MAPLPKKLKRDAIVEAIFELRFECSELAEVVVGRLVDVSLWKDYEKQRLALSDVPSPIRASDSQLRFQPIIELRDPAGKGVAKIGSNVVSYHVFKPYCGWHEFKPLIDQMCDSVFNLFDGFNAVRFGFRYVNVLTKDDHFISCIQDLNASIQVAGKTLEAPTNLNYQLGDDTHRVLVRIASPEFVQSSPNVADSVRAMAALIDVDVYSPPKVNTKSVEFAKAWVNAAHDKEKEEFFRLIPEPVLQKLIEE